MGTLLLLASCWQSDHGELEGHAAPVPADFRFLGARAPCYLEVGSDELRSIRVNCFHIEGNLHIHSNRFARFPRLRGESWVEALRREPQARVSIAGNIYSVRGTPFDDPADRETVLHARGYWYAWDGITIFRFSER
jgi:hypothetical protein